MAPRSQKPVENLHEGIGGVFEQVQASLANHKKNCVALYKIHASATETVRERKGGVQFVGEEAFQDVFVDMASRVLNVKKGNGAAGAERVIKFIGTFVRFMNEKVVEAKSKAASSSSNVPDDDEENSTTRFVARVLTWLLQGFVAKNKVVRYRCVQIVAEMISHLGEIDEDTYSELRDLLIDRLNDKEANIRAHAVIALSKLVGSEDPGEGEQSILQTLLESLESDPAPEVRRAALLHIPVLPGTLDILLRRTRDVDPVTRKLVYTSLLGGKLKHPKQLTIAQRELIVKDGLGDREAGVRVVAGKVVGAWFDWAVGEVGNEREEDLGWEGDDGGVMRGLIKLLGLFDVVGPGEAVAVDAVLSIFTTRREVLDIFVFPETYWKNLTPESVVLARIFVDHCTNTKNELRLESASLPVVTAFAFHVQEAYNSLLSSLEEVETARMLIGTADGQEENEELEEELAKKEVVMGELLRLALSLDYGDEIGRRKVFSVVKDMLAHPELPPGLIERCLDVLKEIMPSERDLIRVIVEIIVELREIEEPDPDDPPIPDDGSDVSNISTTIRREKAGRSKQKSKDTMSAEERQRADLTDMRCLLLCIAMLERVNGSFEDNSTLEGILSDLIVPCVKRKELAMRGKALVSLGLCCLIAKNMALSSFQLFINQAQNAPAELKVEVLKVIMDLLTMYDQEFFGKSEETAKQIIDFLLQTLEAEEAAEAQAVMVTGFCKLLLAGIVTDPKVVMCLALLYISPTTANNQELRQCLAYFFPVYSYSSPVNQSRVQSIFMSTFDYALRLYEDLDDHQEMIAPYQLGLLMVDWTNPQKAVEISIDQDLVKPTHVNLAVDIMIALYDSDRTVDEQKTLLQLLGQLHIASGLNLRSVQRMNILLTYHEEQCPFENAANEKLFDKFSKRFYGLYKDELEQIKSTSAEYLDEEFRDIYQRIGVDVPEDGEVRKSRRRGKRKAKESVEDEQEQEGDETGEEDEDEDVATDEKQEDEVAQNGSIASEDDQETETGSRQESSEPTPKAEKRTRKPPARQTRASTRENSRGKSRQVQEESDEDNIPPLKVLTITPKKHGVKRIHTPGTGNLNSPADRKRKKVKAPLKAKDVTPTNTDSESPTTPTKSSVRPSRGRIELGGGRGHGKAITPSAVDGDEEDADAEVVASMIGSERSTPSPVAVSSDDFGGYD